MLQALHECAVAPGSGRSAAAAMVPGGSSCSATAESRPDSCGMDVELASHAAALTPAWQSLHVARRWLVPRRWCRRYMHDCRNIKICHSVTSFDTVIDPIIATGLHVIKQFKALPANQQEGDLPFSTVWALQRLPNP